MRQAPPKLSAPVRTPMQDNVSRSYAADAYWPRRSCTTAQRRTRPGQDGCAASRVHSLLPTVPSDSTRRTSPDRQDTVDNAPRVARRPHVMLSSVLLHALMNTPMCPCTLDSTYALHHLPRFTDFAPVNLARGWPIYLVKTLKYRSGTKG